MSENHEEPQPRRDFLGKAAFWTTAGTLGFAALGMSRMPMPGVLPGQSSQLKIGQPGEYPVSSEPIRVPGQNLFVLHDADGYAVVGAICTHLGCVVALAGEGFDCPCHGSRFALDGKVVRGPAPSSLPWYEVSIGPDGQMVVDTKKTVPLGTKVQL